MPPAHLDAITRSHGACTESVSAQLCGVACVGIPAMCAGGPSTGCSGKKTLDEVMTMLEAASRRSAMDLDAARCVLERADIEFGDDASLFLSVGVSDTSSGSRGPTTLL